MKNILLLCAEGMSTSMIVQRMETEAKKNGKDYYIHADSYQKADELIPEADIVLVGPQVRFAVQRFQKAFPDKVILDIPMQMYGMFDGKKLLAFAEEHLDK